MPVNFTDSPSNGDTIIGGGLTHTYVSAKSRWETTAGAGLNTEEVQDVVGAMFTGNTETGIAATYQDSDGTVDLVASGDGGLTTAVYATFALLVAATGMSTGDLAYVTATNKLYLYSVNGWFLVATVANTSPTAITGVSATYDLATDATATVVTAVSTDPEGFPLTWSYAVTTGSLTNGGGATATVSQNENVFTITPTTTEAYAGTFSITFSATDGVNGAVNAVGAFTLVFAYDWTATTQQQKIQASDAASSDYFGYSAAIDGNTAIVGAYAEDAGGTDAGAAYIFTRSGTTWSQQQKIEGSDIDGGDAFGYSVAISGDTAIVGAYLEGSGSGLSVPGAVYVFTRSGTTWSQQAKLTASNAGAGDKFGYAIDIDGDNIIVGAYMEDTGGSNAGAAYVYTRSGTTWSQQQMITASDRHSGDYFGYSVSISGEYVSIGAVFRSEISSYSMSGAAYIFTRSGTTWSQQQKILASDLHAGDYYGWSTALSGDTAIVGSEREHSGGVSDTGAAYIWTRSGTTWSQQAKIVASDVSAADNFGKSVDIEGDTVVVGSWGEDTGGSNAGAAYIFTRSGTTWTQDKKIQGSDTGAGDTFGASVSISDSTIIAGAYNEDTGGSNAGAAYTFIAG